MEKMLEENILREAIRKIVNETINEVWKNHEKGKKGSGSSSKSGKPERGMRQFVISALKKSGTNNAPYAKKLWPGKSRANGSSQFAKCKNNEKNDNGSTYSFTDNEITKLYSMLSNGI